MSGPRPKNLFLTWLSFNLKPMRISTKTKTSGNSNKSGLSKRVPEKLERFLCNILYSNSFEPLWKLVSNAVKLRDFEFIWYIFGHTVPDKSWTFRHLPYAGQILLVIWEQNLLVLHTLHFFQYKIWRIGLVPPPPAIQPSLLTRFQVVKSEPSPRSAVRQAGLQLSTRQI